MLGDSQERLTRGRASDKTRGPTNKNYMPKTKTSGETTRLKRVSPQQWRSRVAALPLKIRTEVAHVIWWDWFGGRNVTERWTHLDTFIKKPKWHQPTDAQIIEGLILCGYSQGFASKRIRENSNVKNKK